MHRCLRRPVALISCAAVALALPVAVAAPTAQAADPAVHAEWRGWVAFEQEWISEGGSLRHHLVDRFWTVDVDRASGEGEWAANEYSLNVSDTPCGPSGSEHAGGGTGLYKLETETEYGVWGSNGGGDYHGYPYGTPSIDFGGWMPDEYFTVPEHHFTCGEKSSHQYTSSVLWHHAGGRGDYNKPPLTVANDVSWTTNDGEISRHAVVCMTRSSVDSDNDGLPDPVDLAPAEKGTTLGLGHPDGSQVWDQRIDPQYGGPAGTKGLPQCGTTPTEEVGKSVMVSLGDSYSSGEGVYGYDPKTDEPGVNHCHRANGAYARVGFNALKQSGVALDEVLSFACSGAEAQHLLDEPFCGTGCDNIGESPQITRLRQIAQTSNVGVVTVGVGGNDAGFGGVIQGCLIGGNCVAKFDPEAGQGGKLPKMSLPDVAEEVMRAVAPVRQAAPDAVVVVVGYPVFISTRYDNCPSVSKAVIGDAIGADEAEWIRGQILEVNRQIAAQVKDLRDPNVRFLSLDDVYPDESVLCNGDEADTQWVHGLVERGSDVDPTAGGSCAVGKVFVTFDQYELLQPGKRRTVELGICNESFHPKAEGHAATGQALAACVLTASCGIVNPAGVRPAGELVDEPLINTKPCGLPCLINVGDFFEVSGRGFLPHQIVRVELHSRALVLAEATADGEGNVQATVQVPPGAAVPGPHKLVLVGPGDDTIVRTASTPVQLSCGSGFTDVPADHPFCGDVTWLVSTAVTSGYSDGTYRPALGLSRAQMASFLWRLAGRPAVPASASSFTDVSADSPHMTPVRWLAARGITTGYPDGTFKPDLGLTRAHMAAFLHRFVDQPAPSSSAPTFPDVPADNQFATAISWLAGEGITRGKSDGIYGPADALTRQQMAAFLHRFGEPRGLPE